MENQKDHCEQIEETQAISVESDIEELESREAPKLAANHNETVLRSDD
jgi:hypothetical protein